MSTHTSEGTRAFETLCCGLTFNLQTQVDACLGSWFDESELLFADHTDTIFLWGHSDVTTELGDLLEQLVVNRFEPLPCLLNIE